MKGVVKKDWTLLAIGSSADGTLSPVQLQKSLFIFGQMKKKIVGPSFYTFEPYNYGPFCQAIYSDAEVLECEGNIQIQRSLSRRWPEYSVTKAGMERVEEVKGKISEEDYDYLSEVVNWSRSLTFAQLVKAIYKKYPEYKKNSVFQD